MLIGIDVGGTHTDGVLLKCEESIQEKSKSIKILCKVKKPTTSDILSGLLKTLDTLIEETSPEKIKRIVLSTTLATNALVLKKVPEVALLLFPGPGVNPESAFFGQENIILQGYVDHRGRIVQKPDSEQIEKKVLELKDKGFKHFAITGKFSCRNPVLELNAASIVKKIIPDSRISTGHKLSGSLNFPRRAATSCLNSCVMDIQKQFIASIKRALNKRNISATVHILKADGGTFTLEESLAQPVQAIKSGPAASIMGGYTFSGGRDGIIVDIGGTTTDIGFLLNGNPLFLPGGIELENLKTLIPGFLTISIPSGGDSLVQNINGTIKIGPERLGPAAAFNGPAPTPTDALIALKKIKVNKSEEHRAKNAINTLLHPGINDDIEGVANKIIKSFSRQVCRAVEKTRSKLMNQPVFTIHELLENFDWKPQFIFGMGGPASSLTHVLAKDLGLKPFLLPHSEVTNALGAALSRPTRELTFRIDTAEGFFTLIEKGIRKEIKQGIKLNQAKASQLVIEEAAKYLRVKPSLLEITEQEAFNVVRGFSTLGQIHHLKVQIKPGLILKGAEIQ